METDQSAAAKKEGLFPVRPMWFKLGFFLFLMAWLSYMLFEAAAWQSSEDYLFIYILAPIVYAVLIYRSALLLAPDQVFHFVEQVEFLKDIREDESVNETESMMETESEGRESKAEEEKYAVYMLLWVAALPVAMYLFGMAWTLPIYIFGFTWFFTGDTKRAALVTTVAVAFIYLLFIEILNVLLWTGHLGLPNPLEFIP